MRGFGCTTCCSCSDAETNAYRSRHPVPRPARGRRPRREVSRVLVDIRAQGRQWPGPLQVQMLWLRMGGVVGDKDRGVNIAIEYLRQCLAYDAATGRLTWRTRPVGHFRRRDRWLAWNATHAGKPAGHTRRRDGRRRVRIGEFNTYASRAAWALHYGEWPPSLIDHRDRDETNDAISNLRLAIPAENCRNSETRRHNTLGVKGVRKGHRSAGYTARIRVDGKEINLGTFPTIDQASAAYCAAADRYHGAFACHGTDRRDVIAKVTPCA